MRDNVLCDYAIGFLDICYLSIQSSWRLTFTFANLVVRCNEGRNGAACRTSSSVSEEGGQLSDSIAKTAKPSGTIQNPTSGRNPTSPPRTSRTPVGILTRRSLDFLKLSSNRSPRFFIGCSVGIFMSTGIWSLGVEQQLAGPMAAFYALSTRQLKMRNCHSYLIHQWDRRVGSSVAASMWLVTPPSTICNSLEWA
jgi:hypothetical protein